MPHSLRQFASQLEVCWKGLRVCGSSFDIGSTLDGAYFRYLYYQMFGIDACFRFKRRQISSYKKDPELGPGYAYVVAWEPYREYLRRFTDQTEVRRAPSFQVVLTNIWAIADEHL